MKPLALLTVWLSTAAFAATPPVRLLLSVGTNYGAPDEAVLQFAERDAERIRDVFVDLGGVDASRALVLKRATAQSVRDALLQLRGRVDELHASGRDVALFVFVSGHGSAGTLHLTATDLPIAELRQLTTDTHADLRVEIVDACEAGPSRDKGARKGQGYSLTFQPQPVRGEVFIASSSAHEAAQEWDVLGGSLFTHHWLTALRGDADLDGDGKVTLMEAYTHAARRTLAESIDVGQHPAYEVALRGPDDLVLTEPRKGNAQVSLAAPLEGRFVLVSQPQPDVVAELYKQSGRDLRIAVPPGRYLLRHTTGRRVGLQEVDLPYGGTAQVDGKQLVYRDFSEVAMKGAEPAFHPGAVVLEGEAAPAPLVGTGARWAGAASYRYALGELWGAIGASASGGHFEAVNVSTREQRFAARLGGGYRLWLGPLVVMPGAFVEPAVLRQHFSRADDPVLSNSYPPLPDHYVFGLTVGPELLVEIPLAGPVFAQVGGRGELRYLPAAEQSSWTLGAAAELGIGVNL